jgi:hypothetical protein
MIWGVGASKRPTPGPAKNEPRLALGWKIGALLGKVKHTESNIVSESSVLSLTKGHFANFAIAPRQSLAHKHFSANSAGHPVLLIDFVFVCTLLIKITKVALKPLALCISHR